MKLKEKLAIQYIRAQLNILSLVSTRKAAVKAFKLFCTPPQRIKKKGSPFFEKGEVLSFKQEGHTLRGRRWLPGHMAPEKKVLIAHGFQSASVNFEAYAAALVEKGYEVVAFDAPAHGRSGGKRIVLPEYVRMLRSVNQYYGPFHSYLGHSLGGLALTLFLEGAPHNNDNHLVLVSPLVEMTEAVATLKTVLQLPDVVIGEMNEYVEEISGHPFSWYSLRRALGQIQAKTIYVQDEDDRITPMSSALAVKNDNHPNIRFIFTKGFGHRRIYKDPDVRRQIVQFL